MNPAQIVTKRQQSSSLLSDTFDLSFVSQVAVALLTPPALPILVFLRHKLGYRLLKPLLLLAVVQMLLWIAFMVNALSYGWLLLERHTALGDMIHSTHVSSAMPVRVPLADRPKKDRWSAPGMPGNWWDLTDEQQRAWMQQHPREGAAMFEVLNKRFSETKTREDAEDQKIMAEMAKEAIAEKERRFIPHLSMFLFAAAFVWLALRRRKEGGRLIREGWHTMSRGESYLSRWKPGINEYYLQAYYEPGLVFLLGLLLVILGLLSPKGVIIGVLWPFSISLGLWLMFAAACLSLSEIALMDLAVNEALDRHDAEVETRQNVDIRIRIRSSLENQHVADHAGVRRGAIFDPETAAYLQARAAESPA